MWDFTRLGNRALFDPCIQRWGREHPCPAWGWSVRAGLVLSSHPCNSRYHGNSPQCHKGPVTSTRKEQKPQKLQSTTGGHQGRFKGTAKAQMEKAQPQPSSAPQSSSSCGWGVQVTLGGAGRCVHGAGGGCTTRNVGVEYLRKYSYTLSIKSSMLWRFLYCQEGFCFAQKKEKVFHLLCFLI